MYINSNDTGLIITASPVNQQAPTACNAIKPTCPLIPPARQNGSSLLEVMVAVLITAVGLLGLAALQNTSLKLSYDSFLRTQASFIAYDLIDRVRANSDAAPYELGATDSLAASGCYYVSDTDAGCTKSEVRLYDLYTWKKQVSEVLPGAVPIVAYDASTQLYSLTLKWDDRNEADGTTLESKQFVYHFQIN